MDNNLQFQEDVDEEKIKEMFAHFGRAYYFSECLHKELANYHAIVDFQSSSHITRPRVEEKLQLAFSLTLGQLFDQLRDRFPIEMQDALSVAIEKRNFLAHHFWFERSYLMFSLDGVSQMIQELEGMSGLFTKVDKQVSVFTKSKHEQMGITDEVLQYAFEEAKAGKPLEPFPDFRKIKKQERIVNAWEVTLQNGNKPLIFESEDGCLWQLCEVGLGWTYCEKKANWKIKAEIQHYLPANINPRPKGIKPWDYHFNLSKAAIFWVKPGRKPKTFLWGVKQASKSAY